MVEHYLVKRIVQNPLGARVRVICQTHGDGMPHHGTYGEAAVWVREHTGADEAAAKQLVRDAERLGR